MPEIVWHIWTGLRIIPTEEKIEPTLEGHEELIDWLDCISNRHQWKVSEVKLEVLEKKKEQTIWNQFQGIQAKQKKELINWHHSMDTKFMRMQWFKEDDPYGWTRWVQGLEDDRIVNYWATIYDRAPDVYIPVLYTLESLYRSYFPLHEHIRAGDYIYSLGFTFDDFWFEYYQRPILDDYYNWKKQFERNLPELAKIHVYVPLDKFWGRKQLIEEILKITATKRKRRRKKKANWQVSRSSTGGRVSVKKERVKTKKRRKNKNKAQKAEKASRSS